MTTTDLAMVIDNWAAAWSAHDADRFIALFTDDCVSEDVPVGVVNQGKQQLRDFANVVFEAFPDYAIQLTTRFAAGSFGSAEWLMTGTHQGDLGDMPASHKRMSVRGASVFELQGGKIRRNSDYWDNLTFLKQLGFLPSS